MQMMRSAMVVASIWSWVTRIVVTPRRSCSALDLGAHGEAQGRIEIGQRLVEQQERRVLDQRAGQARRAVAGRPTAGSAGAPSTR